MTPPSKRTRASTEADDNEQENAHHEASDAPTLRPRRSPVRRTVSTPIRTMPGAPSVPGAPSRPPPRLAPPRTRAALSTSPCPSIFAPATRSTNSPSAMPGPSGSTRGGALVRAASMSAVPTTRSLKAAAGGSGPPAIKGDDSGATGSPRRFGKGKENIPPPREPVQPPAPEGSRKRVRVSSSRTRSASTVSMRSESAYSARASTSSCLPSPSPSPSTTVASEDMEIDCTTPTRKQPAPAPLQLLTPPPSSPLPGLASGLEDMAVCSRTASREDERTFANPYKALKAALRLSSSGSSTAAIIGREDEKAVLSSYLSLVSTSDVGMYISGPPGTGKTALTTAFGHDLAATGDWRVVEVGVMGLKATDVWSRLAAELDCGRSEREVIDVLRGGTQNTFIILDEIDSLLPPAPALPTPSTSHVLSKLFSLPLLSSSSTTIKLVAISNTLDLTVRANLVLPDGAMPQVLPFKAYGALDMTSIVAARLEVFSGDEYAKVDAKAAELLCRKIEAQNGDLRACLSTLSTAVGLAEADWVKKGSGPLVKVALPHVLKAFAATQLRAAAGSSITAVTSATEAKIRSVQLQGRMVLVSLLVFLLRSRAGLPGCPTGASGDHLTPQSLYATYAHLLSHDASPFPPAHESDYRDLFSGLETLGLVRLQRVRGVMRVELCVREDEVRKGLGLQMEGEKGRAEVEAANVWHREKVKVDRTKARAAAAFQRAEDGVGVE